MSNINLILCYQLSLFFTSCLFYLCRSKSNHDLKTMKIVIIEAWIVLVLNVLPVNYHFLAWNKFHPVDMILNQKHTFILHFLHTIKYIPVPQQTPLEAHRPFGTVEQVGVLIAHGTRLRFSTEHWRISDGWPIRQLKSVQQIDGPKHCPLTPQRGH
jgi:hypothetical protein